jgi:hypothetical protein
VAQVEFIWDLEDDPEGNYWHICVEGHGVRSVLVGQRVKAETDRSALRLPGSAAGAGD